MASFHSADVLFFNFILLLILFCIFVSRYGIACENSRFSWLRRLAGRAKRPQQAAKSEEKRLFSQARYGNA